MKSNKTLKIIKFFNDFYLQSLNIKSEIRNSKEKNTKKMFLMFCKFKIKKIKKLGCKGIQHFKEILFCFEFENV